MKNSGHYIVDVKLRRNNAADARTYPYCLPVVRHLQTLPLHPKVTFIVGENGSGKSTLVEAIAVAFGFNAEGGTRNFRFATRRSHSELHRDIALTKGFRTPKDGFFFRAESFYNLATEIEHLDAGPTGRRVIDSYGGQSLHEQSHGESFWSLVMHRFSGKGLYILDEPEAALSPQRQLALLRRIHDLANDESQWIITTHSPILMAYPDAYVYACSERGIERVDYEDTEHFQVMHDFIVAPKRMMDMLFRDERCDAAPTPGEQVP